MQSWSAVGGKRSSFNHQGSVTLYTTSTRQLPTRIAFGSCSSQREDMKCWKAIQLPIPRDIVILMGDNVYAGESYSVEEAYRELTAHRDFRTLRQKSHLIATMDDNDYTNDLERGKRAFLDLFEEAPSSDVRRQDGRGVYAAHTWNNERKDRATVDDQIGTSLQVILLDVRYHATADDLLGDSQWRWLQEQLQQNVTLRLIVSPIQILPAEHVWDCWNSRPDSRNRLLHMLKGEEVGCFTTTILLSGDRHVAAMYRDGDLLEVTSSSLTHSVLRPSCLDNEFDPKHQISPYTYENNFGDLCINWEKRVAEVSIRSVETGEILQTYSLSV